MTSPRAQLPRPGGALPSLPRLLAVLTCAPALSVAVGLQAAALEAGRCQDIEGSAVDRFNKNCGFYEHFKGSCDKSNTEHFNASLMCCACGGGAVEPTPSPAPAQPPEFDTPYTCQAPDCSEEGSGCNGTQALLKCIDDHRRMLEPVVYLNGTYVLPLAIPVDPGQKLVLRGHRAVLLAAPKSRDAAFALYEGSTLVLEDVVLDGFGRDPASQWFGFNPGHRGAVMLVGNGATLVLDRGAAIINSMAAGVFVGVNIPGHCTVILNNTASINGSLRNGIELSQVHNISIFLDGGSLIFGSGRNGVHIDQHCTVALHLDNQASIRDSGASAISIDKGCGSHDVVSMDRGSELVGAAQDGIRAYGESSVLLSMRRNSSIRNAAQMGIYTSAQAEIRLDLDSYVEGSGWYGIAVASDKHSVVALRRRSSVGPSGGDGIRLEYGSHLCSITEDSHIFGSQHDGIVALGDSTIRLQDGAWISNNVLSAVHFAGVGGTFHAAGAFVSNSLSGLILMDVREASFENFNLFDTLGIALLFSGEHLFMSDVTIISCGRGMVVHSETWEGRRIRIADTSWAVKMQPDVRVELENVEIVNNVYGVSCVGPVYGRIGGHIYFNQDFDLDQECQDGAGRLQIARSTSWLPGYTSLRSLISGLLFLGLCGAFVIPLAYLPRQGGGGRARGSQALLALVLAVWASALALVLWISLIFRDSELEPIRDQLWALRREAFGVFLLAIFTGSVIFLLMKSRFSHFLEEQVGKALSVTRDCQFPVVLMRAPLLLDRGILPAHEECRDQGMLKFLDTCEKVLAFLESGETPAAPTARGDGAKVASGGVVSVFFSHQWTSFSHPDPDGSQYHVICRAIHKLARKEGCRLEDLYAWVDYFSIPQDNRFAQKLAINSLPCYASLLHMFVIVAPRVQHSDTGLECNRETYQSRGWCRAEQLCHWALRGTSNIYLADSSGLHPLDASLNSVRFSLLQQVVPQVSSKPERSWRALAASQVHLCLQRLRQGGTSCSDRPDRRTSSWERPQADSNIDLPSWFAQAIYVFSEDSQFSCCRMQHTLPTGEEIGCDRSTLMLPMLGLYANIYRERHNDRFELLYRWISTHGEDVFPPSFKYSSRGISRETVLFGDLVHRLERRLDAEERASSQQTPESQGTEASEGRRSSSLLRRATGVVAGQAALMRAIFSTGSDAASEEGSIEMQRSDAPMQDRSTELQGAR